MSRGNIFKDKMMKIVKLVKEYAKVILNWFCFFKVAKWPNRKIPVGNMKHLGGCRAQIVLYLPMGGRILRNRKEVVSIPAKVGFMLHSGDLRSIVENSVSGNTFDSPCTMDMFLIEHASLKICTSSVNGQLGCFRILVIVNSASVNMGVHVAFWIMV